MMTGTLTLGPHLLSHVAAPTEVRTRVLQVISYLDPSLGGMSAVLPRLSLELLTRHRIDAELCIFRGPGEQNLDLIDPRLRYSTWPSSRVAWLRERPLRRSFEAHLREADVVHIHGLWETSVTIASRFARSGGQPYVVSAHGMLEPWALANKALKKRIYSAITERTNLCHAKCLHALTGSEAEDYRRFGCKQPIAIIPNGVDSPESATPDLFLQHFPALRGQSIVLFLGRIHFKKGLDLLVSAWAALAARFPNAVLVLAGPDSENSRLAIERRIGERGIGSRVVFTGMLDAPLKWSALAAATCFVLPSYSEGFSVAVLEALSMALPVIVSEQCHLPEVADVNAGWVITTELPALEEAITEVLQIGPVARRIIGSHGRELARNYSWQAVAERMAGLYDWLTGGRSPEGIFEEGSKS